MVYEPELSQHHEDVMCQVCGCVEMRKPTNVEEILFDKASQAMNQMRAMKAENDSLKKATMEIRKRMAAIEKRMKTGLTTERIQELEEQAVADTIESMENFSKEIRADVSVKSGTNGNKDDKTRSEEGKGEDGTQQEDVQEDGPKGVPVGDKA